MPKPDEVATVTVGGTVYDQWEWLEAERRIENVPAHVRLRVMEITPPDAPRGWSNLRLKPDDRPVKLTLAGRTFIDDGFVSVRQVAYDATNHQIEIVVASKTQVLGISTPIDSGRQYKNVTFLQFANAITKPYGIKVKLWGDTKGAEEPFERVQVHPGETAKQAIERAASHVNLRLVDDEGGNLIAMRADAGLAAVADLAEGRNIKAAHAIMSIEEGLADVWGVGQQHGNNDHNGDAARDVAAVGRSKWGVWRPLMVMAEMAVGPKHMVMRTDFEAATMLGTVVEAFITVPGWLCDDGSLWSEHIKSPVTIYSPMLFPNDAVRLVIRGVKHRQSNEQGTESIVECCLESGLGGAAWQTDPTPAGNQPAKPESMDQ